jgi:hypothetical protein
LVVPSPLVELKLVGVQLLAAVLRPQSVLPLVMLQ